MSPATRVVGHIYVGYAPRSARSTRYGRSGYRGDSGGAIEMRIDKPQLLEVVRIRLGAQRAGSVCACVREIVHARVLRTAIGGLMVEAEGVSFCRVARCRWHC